MSNVSLYRKYRPNTFEDVVGQENIVKILENAIEKNRISHAYLFNGPRGTGKTSIAKIFAKKTSCICTDDSCEFCLMDYSAGDIADIWEIDAASNNGVDEVRRIVENVSYMPIQMKYKVYIIDEVHMLTKGAFNALLKTLEEPPKHVIFILATTEIHKIPLTIISRCQRFDFKRISEDKLTQRMIDVLNKENISFEIEGLDLIAKLADGGMRDALSLVDKVSIYSKIITKDAVNTALQLVTDENKKVLLDLIISKDMEKVINYWKEILGYGIDENKFIIDMQYFIRDLMLEVVRGQNDSYNIQHLLVYLKLFSELDTKLMYTKNYAIVIEVFLIEMCSQNTSVDTLHDAKVENTIDVNDHLQKLKEQTALLKEEETTIEFKKEEFKNNNIIQNFARDVVEVEFDEVIIEEPKVETKEVIFEKSDFMTPNQIIPGLSQTTKDENDIEEVIVETKEEPNINNQFDLTDFHEEFEAPAYLNKEVVLHDVEPIIEEEHVAPVVVELTEQEKQYNQISVLDVLKTASHENKDRFNKNIIEFKKVLEESRQFGLAKIFDYVTVTAVGENGVVLIIEKSLYETYVSRVKELEAIIYNNNENIGKIFLLEINEWNSKRPMYVEQLKNPKKDDIFDLAQKTFENTIINKI